MNQSKCKVFIKEVAQELAHPYIRPPAVHQQQSLQVSELSKGIVTRHDSLHAFLSTYSNTNVGSCETEGEDTVNDKPILRQNIEMIKVFSQQNKKHSWDDQYETSCSAAPPTPASELRSQRSQLLNTASGWASINICEKISGGWGIPFGSSTQLISHPSHPQDELQAPVCVPVRLSSLATAVSHGQIRKLHFTLL